MSILTSASKKTRLWASGALVTAGLAGGAILGATMTANASTPSSTATTAVSGTSSTANPSGASSSSGSSGSTAAPTRPAFPPHGSAAHEDAETPVTGTAAAKAQAAAVKYVGSGTAGSVTTDFTKQGYEVTVTKADGTKVEVHLDSSFTVMQGGPGHGPGGGPGGAPAPGMPAPSTSAG